MTNQFEETAQKLQLSDTSRAAAWAALRELRMAPDDPEVVRVILRYALIEEGERTRTANAALLDEARKAISNASRESVERVSNVAAKVHKASAAKLAEQQHELVSSVSESIAESADRALTRKVAVHSRNSFAAWLAAGLIASGVMCGVGYTLGKSNAETNVPQISAMLTREDGGEWTRLISANNARAAISTYCQAGSTRVHQTNSGTYCDLPMWLSRSDVVGVSPSQGIDTGAGVLTAWLASWGPWWLLGTGTLGFLALRLLAAWTAEFEPLRRLLALPPRTTLKGGVVGD